MEHISNYINEIYKIQQDMRVLFEQENEETLISCKEILTDDEIIDILECMNEYIDEHPTLISEPYFDEIFLQDMQILFPCCCENIEEIIELFYILFVPKRSQEDQEDEEDEKERETIHHKIDYLHSQPQHIQRTVEWYEFRNNLITASNAYKIFETNATRNQLIYEKCIAYEKKRKVGIGIVVGIVNYKCGIILALGTKI